MKIATWNVERLKHRTKMPIIAEICEQVAADIFVLTETDSDLKLKYKSHYQTLPPAQSTPGVYRSTENRVTIFTNYEILQRQKIFNEQTAICVELLTERGSLLVYGCVVGIYGNRHKNYLKDLVSILTDIEHLKSEGKQLCVCGDFNCSFSDNYYYTKASRAAFEEAFSKNGLSLLTKNQPECIDHIAISRSFIGSSDYKVKEWNLDKKLSDHKGIWVELMP